MVFVFLSKSILQKKESEPEKGAAATAAVATASAAASAASAGSASKKRQSKPSVPPDPSSKIPRAVFKRKDASNGQFVQYLVSWSGKRNDRSNRWMDVVELSDKYTQLNPSTKRPKIVEMIEAYDLTLPEFLSVYALVDDKVKIWSFSGKESLNFFMQRLRTTWSSTRLCGPTIPTFSARGNRTTIWAATRSRFESENVFSSLFFLNRFQSKIQRAQAPHRHWLLGESRQCEKSHRCIG